MPKAATKKHSQVKEKAQKQRLLTIALPVYEMRGTGHIFLKDNFERMLTQTFQDFDVVISDYSPDDTIKKLCESYKKKLDIHYFKNTDPNIGLSANVNNAIRHSTGKLIKILFQDDFLYGDRALEDTVNNFDLDRDVWLATGCIHTTDGVHFSKPHRPKYTEDVLTGNNRIGSPSVITIKNNQPLLFDPHLKWLVDCDYYKRYVDRFGLPKLIKNITVAIRTGDHQITNNEATNALRQYEYDFVIKKHGLTVPNNRLQLPKVSLVAVTGLNPAGAIDALEKSMAGIDFHEVILIAHTKPDNLNPKITFKQCKPTELANPDPKNTDDYSRFMAYNLIDYINSDYALIVHKNAYVLRPHKWDKRFLNYDYVGAPWPAHIHYTPEGVNVRVGNGGFSLRSRKMMNALNDLNLSFTDNGTGYYHEDGILCVYYRKQLEEYGITFAPVDVAARFSLERECPESTLFPFGFHDNKKAVSLLTFLRDGIKRRLSKVGR